MSRSTRSGLLPTAEPSIYSALAISSACFERTGLRSRRSPCRPRRSALLCRRSRRPVSSLPRLRGGSGWGPTTYVSAAPPARRRSSGTRRSSRLRSWDRRCIRSCRCGPHRQLAERLRTSRRNSSSQAACARATRALRSPETAAGALVGLFAGRIDASGIVLVALAAALRHLRRSLRVAEALRGSDVSRTPLIDRRQDYLSRFAYVRAPHMAHILAARAEGPRPPVPLPIQSYGDL